METHFQIAVYIYRNYNYPYLFACCMFCFFVLHCFLCIFYIATMSYRIKFYIFRIDNYTFSTVPYWNMFTLIIGNRCE